MAKAKEGRKHCSLSSYGQESQMDHSRPIDWNISFQPRAILPSRGYLAMSGIIFVNTIERDTIGILWVEAKDAVKHPMMHRATPNNQELFGPKGQGC